MIVKLILFALAGVFNAVMDKLQFHYGKSIFPNNDTDKFLGGGIQYWKPSISWKNKYKDWDGGDKRPKFLFAKTALVFLTDGWHFAQFLMLTCFSAACVPPVNVWWMWFVWFVGLRFCFSVGFTVFFDRLLAKETTDT